MSIDFFVVLVGFPTDLNDIADGHVGERGISCSVKSYFKEV